MPRHYVFMMFGYPGSGKSFVAEWLTLRFNAVRMRADDLRIEMFNGDRPDLYTPENKALVNNAIRYTYGQILQTGNSSVVLDANYNQRATRKTFENLAHHHGVIPVVVWVKTPISVAKERIESRVKTTGQVIFDPRIIEKMLKRMQPPKDDENLIVLNGLHSIEEQKASFEEQFGRLKTKQDQTAVQ